MARTFYIARHAESLGNAGIPGVGPDPGLSHRGWLQAHALAQRIAGETAVADIWASPFRRAVQTACVVARATGAQVRLEPAMHEFFYADWYDLTTLRLPSLAETAAAYPGVTTDADDAHWWPRRSEDYPDLDARLAALAQRLLRDARPGVTLLVGHGASVASLTNALVPPTKTLIQHVQNASITEVREDAGECELVRFNDVAHLEGLLP